MDAGDGVARQMAQKQGADPAMAHKQNWNLSMVLKFGEGSGDGGDDSRLRVLRPLPASHTLLRAGEEGVGHLLEFNFRQVTCCGTVVFLHPPSHLDGKAKGLGEERGGLLRLHLGGGNDSPVGGEIRACGKGARARPPDLRQAPAGHRHGRVHRDLRVG